MKLVRYSVFLAVVIAGLSAATLFPRTFSNAGHAIGRAIATLSGTPRQVEASCRVGTNDAIDCGSPQSALNFSWREGIKGEFAGADPNYELIANLAEGAAPRQFARGVGLLWILDNDQNAWIPCTAFLISDEHLLTAGHCVMKEHEDNKWRKIRQARFVLGFREGSMERAQDLAHKGAGSVAWLQVQLGITPQCKLSDIAGEDEVLVRHPDTAAFYRASDGDKGLDYALLGLCPGEFQREVTERSLPYGKIDIAAVSLEEKHDLVMIHHPSYFKQVLTQRYCRTVDGNANIGMPQNFNHLCDSHSGSSGAPIFSRRHEAVTAIHTCCDYSHGSAAELAVSNFNRAVHIAAVAEVNDVVKQLMIKQPLTAEQRQRLAEVSNRSIQSRNLLRAGNSKLAAFVAYDGLSTFSERADRALLTKNSRETKISLQNAIFSLHEHMTVFSEPEQDIRAVFGPKSLLATFIADQADSIEIRNAITGAFKCGTSTRGKKSNDRSLSDVQFLNSSEDQTFFASITITGSARIWDAETCALWRELKHGEKGINDIAINPDGTMVATASADGFVKLWNIEDSSLQGSYKHEAAVVNVTFSEDGKRIATTSENDIVTVWSIGATSRLSRLAHNSRPACAQFLSNPDHLFTLTQEGAAIWSLESGEPISKVTGKSDPSGYVRGYVRKRCPKLHDLFALYDDDKFTFYDIELKSHNRKEIRIPDLDYWVLSRDGKFLATNRIDESPIVRFASTGDKYFEVQAPINTIPVAFDVSSRFLLTVGFAGAVQVWDVALRVPNSIIGTSHAAPSPLFRFSADGQFAVVSTTGNCADVWNLKKQMKLRSVCHRKKINSINVDPAIGLFLTASDDGTARAWALESDSSDRPPLYHEHPVNSAEFGVNGNILTVTRDGDAFIWKGNRKESIGSVKFAHFSRDGRNIIVGNDRNLNIWRIDSPNIGKEKVEIPICSQPRDASLSASNNKVLVLCGKYATVIDIRNKEFRQFQLSHYRLGGWIDYLVGGEDHFRFAAFDPTGGRILTIGTDKTIRIWDAESGAPVGDIIPLDAIGAAFAPTGDEVVIYGREGKASVFDTNTGQRIETGVEVNAEITYAEYDVSGKYLATVTADGFVKIWDASPTDDDLMQEAGTRLSRLSIIDPNECLRYRLNCNPAKKVFEDVSYDDLPNIGEFEDFN